VVISALAAYFPKALIADMPAGHAPQIVLMDLLLDKLASFQAGVGN